MVLESNMTTSRISFLVLMEKQRLPKEEAPLDEGLRELIYRDTHTKEKPFNMRGGNEKTILVEARRKVKRVEPLSDFI